MQIGGFTFDQNISRVKLARAIILHEYSLSIVDHVAFKDFASSLQPLFKMVSRNTIKDDIMKIYEVEKGKMSSYLMSLFYQGFQISMFWVGGKQMGLSIQLYKRLFEISTSFRYLQLHLSRLLVPMVGWYQNIVVDSTHILWRH